MRDTIVVDRSLLEALIKENERLKSELAQYKKTDSLQPQVLEGQISIEGWLKEQKQLKKSLKLSGGNQDGHN